MPTSTARAHAAALLAQVLLGAGAVVGQLAVADAMHPIQFAFLREALAAPVVGAMAAACAPARPAPALADAALLLELGALLFATNGLYIVGVDMVGAVAAATWQASLPVAAALLGAVTGDERLTPRRALGAAAAAAACALLVRADKTAAPRASGAGHAVLLLQVAACAAFFRSERAALARFGAPRTLAYAYVVAAGLMGAVLLGVVAVEPALGPVRWDVPPAAWAGVGYWVCVGSVASYWLLSWANARVGAVVVGLYFACQPVGALLARVAVSGAGASGAEGWGVVGVAAALAWAGSDDGPTRLV